MKKLFCFLLAAAVVLGTVRAIPVAAEEEKINEVFLADGELLPPESNYIVVESFNGYSHQRAKEYTTQSQQMMELIAEWDRLGYEAFVAEYGFALSEIRVQHDCRLDGGDWHYTPSWDDEEYDYQEMPDIMCLYPITPAFQNAKVISSGYNIDLYYMDESGSDWGFFKDIVSVKKGADGEKYRFLDLKNHTLGFRSRYYIDFITFDADENGIYHRMFSDWCPETSIGKNGMQEELKAPEEKIEPPVLRDMTLANIGEICLDWKVFFEIPDSTYRAQKYYWIIEDWFEPLIIECQIRVNGGEWTETLLWNQNVIYGGFRGFETFDIKEGDKIEFRARFYCNADETKTSDWSNTVSNEAVDPQPLPPSQEESQESGGELVPEDEPRTKCKVCGICPFQPLGICLFIWLAIILILFLLITALVLKSKKKKKEKQEKVH